MEVVGPALSYENAEPIDHRLYARKLCGHHVERLMHRSELRMQQIAYARNKNAVAQNLKFVFGHAAHGALDRQTAEDPRSFHRAMLTGLRGARWSGIMDQ
jgi:S-adenosylmethionine:tRNA-ribosyltransferase-isomerase (queuine synthetase)